ncbi:MAG: DUF4886 domain-containing protein [Lachnospiraceae bacterium]|nr:DUF4886 domain-containing protein [Lachnospiraceae bacterium]
MKSLKILAIGNSFSEDATRYLHQLAENAGINSKVVNLFIGGCSLKSHWLNIESDEVAYQYQLNGYVTERKVSIDEVLLEEEWDYITVQQASPDSGWADSYEPFLGRIIKHVKEKVPAAKILIHETWAYEVKTTHKFFARYNRNQQEMYEKLHRCYKEMADKYKLEVIPSGTVIQKVRQLPEFYVQEGGRSLCRDGFHMTFDYGRYLLACIWLRKLTGISVCDLSYIPESPVLKEIPDNMLFEKLRKAVERWVS